MYGISILSLVSTASLRNWSVFLFLEEGKENSVSPGQRHGLTATPLTRLWVGGVPLAPDAGLSQTGGCVPGPSKQQGCSMCLSSGSAWIGLLGQTVGPEPPPTPIPSCHPEQTYSAWPSCTNFCSSSSTRASLALHWVTKCRISSLPSFPNMLAAALDRPRDYKRRQGKQESGRQM